MRVLAGWLLAPEKGIERSVIIASSQFPRVSGSWHPRKGLKVVVVFMFVIIPFIWHPRKGLKALRVWQVVMKIIHAGTRERD